MKDIIEKNKCTGCMACANICHKNAIQIQEDENGFLYPEIDNEKCINCGLCKKVCPVLSNIKEKEFATEVYCCKNKDEKVRMKSSSGGIFSLIAETILEEDGIVFGACINEDREVVHDYIEDKKELFKLRGSKYVQSQIRENYKKAKEFLNEKRKVFFTGTPCQIEGLLSYLGKEYDNLYTQDFICHGVPSPKVWRKYMEYKKQKNGEYPKNVEFRSKDILGWSSFQIRYEYKNSSENVHHDDDPYMKFFLRNFDLRESCYNCHFKKINRKSDITVADSWGINESHPKFNDEKGISTILVHTAKGKEILNKIKDRMDWIEEDIENVKKYNSPICKSVKYNELREEFFYDLERKDFESIIEKYLPKNI